MAAPKNPYRQPDDLAWSEVGEGRAATLMSNPRESDLDISHQPIGLAATDIDSIARRNYVLGRKQARRDAEGELAHLRRQLAERPAKAYDEGYDAGAHEAERGALDQIIALLGPARVIAEEYSTRRGRASKRLTPKQREERAAELAGYVIAITNVLRSLEPLVEEAEARSVNDARTPEGLKALREFVAKHGAPPFPFPSSGD